MQPILIYNWKTYITSEDDALNVMTALQAPDDLTLVVCPSAVHIAAVRDIAGEKGIRIGAQDISVSRETPQTGRQSGEQLRALGVRYVLAGHAETRANGVTNAMVAEKALHALSSDIIPVICLSEQKGNEEYPGGEAVDQLKEIVERAARNPKFSTVIIAYEPTAHIGADAALDTAAIRDRAERLRAVTSPHGDIPVLYGGSVTATNVSAILTSGAVDGFLLGRAGSDAETANAVAAAL